jgi:hypothetical protein
MDTSVGSQTRDRSKVRPGLVRKDIRSSGSDNLQQGKEDVFTNSVLIPQVRRAHKYPNSPWEMIHPPGGDNAVCM